MNSEMKKGMRLCQTADSDSRYGGWILQGAVTLCAYCALAVMLLEVSGLGAIANPVAMLLTGGLLCVLFVLLMKFQQQRWFYPGLLLLLLLVVIFGRAQLLEGIRLFWNQFGTVWTAGTGRALPKLETQLVSQTLCLNLLSAVLGCILAMLCCLLTARAGWVLAVLLPGGVLATVFGLRCEIATPVLLLVLATAILLLLNSGWGARKAIFPILLSSVLCGALVLLLLSVAAIPAVEHRAAELSRQMQNNMHEKRYETAYNTLPEGDFTDYKPNTGGAKPALVVTMDTPEAMYLRGFTGATFAEDVWQTVDNQTLANSRDLLYWLNLEAFSPNAQFAAAAQQQETNRITIQNLGACSRYLYVPFSLQAGDYLQAEDLHPDSVHSDGTRTYVYTVVQDAARLISDTLEELQDSDAEAVLEYRRAESAYRQFVHDNYLQVPQDVTELLGAQWNEVAANYSSSDSLTPQEAQECALTFLSACFPEEGTPEDLELPLEAVDGTSYQYATVAALTLRHFGIPTRYAEGYVISQKMVEEAGEDTTLTVDSTHAAAWVEIYQDGIGWIPMDLTPGFGDLARDSKSDNVSSSSSVEGESAGEGVGQGYAQTPPHIQEGMELEEEPPMEEMIEPPLDDPQITLRQVLWKAILLILLLLVLLALLMYLRRRRMIRRLAQKFCAENCNDGIAWIFGNTALLLGTMGLDRGNGSMQTLCEPLEQRFGAEYAAAFQTMVGLNARAMFSSRPLTEDELDTALDFRNETIQKLNAETKWNKRIWIRWIQCLY